MRLVNWPEVSRKQDTTGPAHTKRSTPGWCVLSGDGNSQWPRTRLLDQELFQQRPITDCGAKLKKMR